MLSRFHDTRGEHGFDSHSSPGFQPDHSRSGWDYLLENWSHPRISTKVSNYFKTLKGENAFWRANWIITPLEGVSPFEAAITGEEAGKEVERSRITSDDQEEKEAALKVYFGCLLIHHLADGPSILCKPPWPTSGGARPEDGVPDHLQAAGLQLHRFFHPFIHRPTSYSQRIAEGSWNDCKVKNTIFGGGVDFWIFLEFFIFFFFPGRQRRWTRPPSTIEASTIEPKKRLFPFSARSIQQTDTHVAVYSQIKLDLHQIFRGENNTVVAIVDFHNLAVNLKKKPL